MQLCACNCIAGLLQRTTWYSDHDRFILAGDGKAKVMSRTSARQFQLELNTFITPFLYIATYPSFTNVFDAAASITSTTLYGTLHSNGHSNLFIQSIIALHYSSPFAQENVFQWDKNVLRLLQQDRLEVDDSPDCTPPFLMSVIWRTSTWGLCICSSLWAEHNPLPSVKGRNNETNLLFPLERLHWVRVAPRKRNPENPPSHSSHQGDRKLRQCDASVNESERILITWWHVADCNKDC